MQLRTSLQKKYKHPLHQGKFHTLGQENEEEVYSETDEIILENLRQIQERREIRAQERQNLDEEDHFGYQIAAVMRRLPIQKRSLAKIKIQQFLHELEFSEESL